MLSKLSTVGRWFQNEPESSWIFDEFLLNEEAKLAFSKLDLDIQIFDHSARINVTTNKNHCYIPSHYFLYVLKLQPLVSLLSCYMDIFDQVKKSVSTAVEFHDLISSPSPSNDVINNLDSYSRSNFISVFLSKNNRLGGKDIINEDKIKKKKYRSQDDFMISILLKALPVPDSSSSVLGDLLYAFSKSQVAYKVLMDNYSKNVPHIFRAESGNELIFMILSTLSWQKSLDSLLEITTGRFSDWGSIDKAFLFSLTPVSGNTQYVEEPIHYSSSLNHYVHIKKGLLDTEELIEAISELILPLWNNMSIQKDGGEFLFRSSSCSCIRGPIFEGATNKIYYGAPGTGKSYKIHTEECKGAEKVVTVFHPDTQYNDFVGSLKPKMEIGSDGQSVVTYQFRPGPFTNALVKAKSHPDKHICLVIEEINRAPASAVFGELFQLLDRNNNGQSTYKIDAIDPDMLLHINERLRLVGASELLQLEIPANLSILATMNSSDQAVMPMDAAFKRRWSFQYIEIDFDNFAVLNDDFCLTTANGQYDISWPNFAQIINDTLIDCYVAEDRLLGPFFVTKEEMKDKKTAKETLNGKLLVYLWDDVLRHLGHTKLFSSKYKTFGKLSSAFNKDMAVFNSIIEEKIEKKGQKVGVGEASTNAAE